ncbi:hypothetical protein [Thermogemmatispora carboxidivorans]|uniref:hypothetical protein n=1 Tax=Thermogemmatispora carboxidivorans TaxID=1382306 RepID=UPI00069AE09B|nr:hypothetical protein [Thermogemmatispora carboxidivorans]
MTLWLALALTGLWLLIGLFCGLLGCVAHPRWRQAGWRFWLLLLGLAMAGAVLSAWPAIWLLGRLAASALALGCSALVTLAVPPWLTSHFTLAAAGKQRPPKERQPQEPAG